MEENNEILEENNPEEETEKESADSCEQTDENPQQEERAAGDQEETEEPEEGDEQKEGSIKGFFKKKKDKKEEQIEELNDRVKRQMAEFENFRKRSEKEKMQMYDMGAKSMIEKVLPVIDNFERGLAAVPEEQKEDAFVTGMDKIYKQLLTELETVGVKPIEAVGAPFDPEYHNAVMQVESNEYESGIIAQELQKGYLYKDSVVRHSMVAVVS